MVDQKKIDESLIIRSLKEIRQFVQKTEDLAVEKIAAKMAAPPKKVAEAVDESEAKYRTLLENLPQKIYFKNKDSVYMSCNNNYARDLGVKIDEIIGKTDYDLFPKKVAEKFRRDDKNIMESGKIEDIEESYIKGEQERFVHTVKTPVKDKDGNVVGILGVLWDITERKEIERHLLEAEKLATVGRLAAGFAHEINNPLASILLNIQMMSHTIKKEAKIIPNSKAYVKTLEKVEDAVNRCKRIGAGLLTFSRPRELKLGHTNVNKVIEGSLGSLEHQLKVRKVKTVKDFAARLPAIMVDGQQLGEVFNNLIINACEAMSKGGKFRIVTRLFRKPEAEVGGAVIHDGEKTVEIELSDTGKGIPEEDLPKVFDPFFTTKGRGEGVGLGLAISYGIIKNHGGSIEVTSEKAKGTTFIVRLPANIQERNR